MCFFFKSETADASTMWTASPALSQYLFKRGNMLRLTGILTGLLILFTAAFFSSPVSSDTGVDTTNLSGNMNYYFGSLHGHSNKSDGDESPSEVLAHARDVAGFDFYALTDHGEFLFGSEWDTIKKKVDAYNDDHNFIALRGFEFSHNTDGHMNVFNTSDYNSSILFFTMPWMYYWISVKGGYGQFNHPGDAAPLLTFWNMQLSETAYDNMMLVETGNGIKGNVDGRYIPYYIKALDKGWRVAPSNNLDNHSLWFDKHCHRTVIIAEELTRSAILDAISQRRVYSSDDADIEIAFRHADGTWMGSETEVNIYYDTTTQFYVEVKNNEAITKLELISNGGDVVAEQLYSDGETEVIWTPVVEVSDGDYFFVKVTEHNTIDVDTDSNNDGDTQIALTAPIWINTVSISNDPVCTEVCYEETQGCDTITVCETVCE